MQTETFNLAIFITNPKVWKTDGTLFGFAEREHVRYAWIAL